VDEIKDIRIDSKRLLEHADDVMVRKGYIDPETGLLGDEFKSTPYIKAKSIISRKTTSAGKPIKRVGEIRQKIDMRTIKDTIDYLDDNISWNNLREADKPLRAWRDLLRQELGAQSKIHGKRFDYDEIATGIHDRLTLFGAQEKKLRKLGGKESVGRSIFTSSEAKQAWREMLEGSPHKISGKALGTLDQMEGWVAWNDFWGQNADLYPTMIRLGAVPVRTGGFKVVRKPLKKLTLQIPQGTKQGVRQGVRATLATEKAKEIGSTIQDEIR